MSATLIRMPKLIARWLECAAFAPAFVCLLLLAFAAGCASNKRSAPTEHAFFPPAPDVPRIQYLMSFSSEADLGGSGKFNTFIVGREKLQRPIWKPYGITTTPGKLFVVDTMPMNISITDFDKDKLRYIRPQGSGRMYMPINVAVAKDGTIFVTDTGGKQPLLARVIIFNAEGNYIGTITETNKGKPCGIAVDDEKIYVTYQTNQTVEVYSLATREPLFSVPADTKDPEAKLFQPTNVAVDRTGRIHVSDTGGFDVQVYDAQGKHIRRIGDLGLTPGTFALPKGIAVDREQRVYVVDAATGVIQLFDDEGRLLMFFGNPGGDMAGGTYLPAGIAVDYDNVSRFKRYVAPGREIEYLIYVTNQAGPNKVSVYGFLKQK